MKYVIDIDGTICKKVITPDRGEVLQSRSISKKWCNGILSVKTPVIVEWVALILRKLLYLNILEPLFKLIGLFLISVYKPP